MSYFTLTGQDMLAHANWHGQAEARSPLHPPDCCTMAEAAHTLRWNQTSVRRHLKSGVIPAWTAVCLPHQAERRTTSRIKRMRLDRVLVGKAKE